MEWPAHLPLVRGGGVSPEGFTVYGQAQMVSKNSNNSVPSFGTDQTVVPGLNPTETSKNT